MNYRQVIQCIMSMTGEERDDFREFVKFKIFKTSKPVQSALDSIFKSVKLREEINYKKIEQNLRVKGKGELISLVENFFLLKNRENPNLSFLNKALMTDFLFERKIMDENATNNELEGMFKDYLESQYGSKDYYYFQYQFEFIKKTHTKLNHNQPNNLELCVSYLDAFYIESILRLACETVNRKKFLPNGSINNDPKENINDLLSHPRIKQFIGEDRKDINILINIYNILKNSGSKNEDDYANLKEWINQTLEGNSLMVKSKSDSLFLKTVIEYLLNFCIKKVNAEEHQYAEDYINYIFLMKENGLLLEQNGFISISRYMNITKMGVLASSIDRVETLITDLEGKLTTINLTDKIATKKRKKNVNQLVPNLCKTYLRLHQGDIETAQNNMIVPDEKEPVNTYVSLFAKQLYFQLAYEDENRREKKIDLLKKELRKFKGKIEKLQISNPYKNVYIRFYTFLLKLCANHSNKTLSKLRKEINSSKGKVLEKKWFLQKILERSQDLEKEPKHKNNTFE